MLRMSFLEHLEELRRRLILALAGLGVAFVLSLTFSEKLWNIVQEPAAVALASPWATRTPLSCMTSPMESFSIIWVKLPMLTSMFLASPWLLYQVWAFVAPGLYKRERRFAAPFIISAAGLVYLGRAVRLLRRISVRTDLPARHRTERQRHADDQRSRITSIFS